MVVHRLLEHHGEANLLFHLDRGLAIPQKVTISEFKLRRKRQWNARCFRLWLC
jgi:hypothetical protein